MRLKFPEGSGGPFEVPGVGRVIGGEEFDWPEDLPPIAGAVPALAEGDGEAPGEGGQESETDEPGETGEGQPPGKGRSRSKE